MITLGASAVDAQHKEVPNSLHFASDDVIPEHHAPIEAVHAHGAKIQPQIAHAGCEMNADAIVALQPEAVIVATGGRIVTPGIPGDELPHVRTGHEIRAWLAGREVDGSGAKLPAWQRTGIRLLGGPAQRLVRPDVMRSVTRA